MFLPFIIFLISYLSINNSYGKEKELNSRYDNKNILFDSCLNKKYTPILEKEDAKRLALLASYPNFIKAIENNYIYFFNGDSIIYDDGLYKNFQERLDTSDPEDMFFTIYDCDTLPPTYLSDAGRSRSEDLFKKIYGSTSSEVQSHLTTINWFGKFIQFSSINNAANQLSKVAKELETKSDCKSFMKCSGTFYWRKERGAHRQSAHSYGIAIDIAVEKSNYWLWDHKGATELDSIDYKNRIPIEIVEIFKKHGFIWGGAWYHYDTMHFEYRPELINYAKLIKESKHNH